MAVKSLDILGLCTPHQKCLEICFAAQALPNWLAEMQITNLDISFCKSCNIDVVSRMTSLQVLSLQVDWHICSHQILEA